MEDTRGDAVVEAAMLFPIIILICAALVLLSIYMPLRAAMQRSTQYAATAIATIGEDFQKTFPLCEEITWRKCRKTSLLERLIQTALRIFSPLM